MENKYLRILNEKKEKPVDGYTPIKGKDYFDGKDGKDGYTPVKGKDYFDGKDGKTPVKGKDYFTKKEVEAFKKEVVPVKGKDYFDGKDGKTPVKGKDYFTKKDILSVKKEVGDSAKEIRDKLETLKGEERLDATAIKHLPLPSPLYGGGGPKDFIELEDVPESYKGQGGKYLRVKNDESGVEFRVGSGGGSGGGAWGEIEGNIEDQLDLQQELAKKMNTVSLATVATSGSYNDLTNKPTIPTVTNDFTNAYKTKLDGIETSATKNDTDANLKNRANHTGTQAISTIDGLQNALDGKQPTGDYITEEDMNTELSSKADLVDGTVPSSQLPSYVDDVLEFNNLAGFPETGEAGKIYVAKDTNKTYRWGGSEYVVISETIALGETSATAYRGDHGKTAYDHSQITSGNPHGTTASDIGAIPTSEKGVASGVATLGLDGLVPATQLPTSSGGGDGQVAYDYIVAANDSTSKAKGGADAVCDGTNDDVEIQAAIDAVAVKGGRVLLHAGTYTLGASVALKSNVSLEGVGNGTVLTTLTNIDILTGSTQVDVSVKNMRINAINSDIAFRYMGARTKVSHVRVERALWLFSGLGVNSVVDSCVFEGITVFGENLSLGLVLQNTTVNLEIDDTKVTDSWRVFIDLSQGATIHNCRFIKNTTTQRPFASGGTTLSRISNCYILWKSNFFTSSPSVAFVNCEIALNGNFSILLARDSSMVGCYVRVLDSSAANSGIYLQGGSVVATTVYGFGNLLTFGQGRVIGSAFVFGTIKNIEDVERKEFFGNYLQALTLNEVEGEYRTEDMKNLTGVTMNQYQAVCLDYSGGSIGVVLGTKGGVFKGISTTSSGININATIRTEGVAGVQMSIVDGDIAQGDYLSLSETPGFLKKAVSGDTVVAVSKGACNTESGIANCLILPNQFILS